MDKDEILAQSRKENKYKDLHEMEVRIKAGNAGGIAAMILATVFFFTQTVLGEGNNLGLYAIVFCVPAAGYIYKAITLKDKSDVLWAALNTFLVVAFSIRHILDLVNASNIL